MRLVRYAVAMSLDGYIAGPNGEFSWIVIDPEIDFSAITAEFDVFLIGRRTFETMIHTNQDKPPSGIEYVVFSRTLSAKDYPLVCVEREPEPVVRAMRDKPGKDTWLFGGGELFRSLLHTGLVDRIEVSVIPVLLGQGIPLLAPPADRTKLKLLRQRLYEKTGTVSLEYEILCGR